ncbi:TPA: hypothetical protein N2782_004597 [Vibrio parahaemolyticus]|nr:hypothetical protein [Vibrio parahaemolyticus]
MEDSLQAISVAIESLQSSPIKDYIFPIVSALFSALLGVWAAFYTVETQEKNRFGVTNVDTINEVLLVASDARNNLIAIKENYVHGVKVHPIQRMLCVPPIILNEKPIELKIVSMAFLVPNSHKQCKSNFERIEYIDSLFQNYNHMLSMWQKRNELISQYMPQLTQLHGKAIGVKELQPIMGQGGIAQLSDLTEHVLMLTDDLLVEISCLLEALPVVAKRSIDKKVIKKYRKLLSMSLPRINESPNAVDLLSLIPSLDINAAGKLQMVDQGSIKQRYRRIYLH